MIFYGLEAALNQRRGILLHHLDDLPVIRRIVGDKLRRSHLNVLHIQKRLQILEQLKGQRIILKYRRIPDRPQALGAHREVVEAGASGLAVNKDALPGNRLAGEAQNPPGSLPASRKRLGFNRHSGALIYKGKLICCLSAHLLRLTSVILIISLIVGLLTGSGVIHSAGLHGAVRLTVNLFGYGNFLVVVSVQAQGLSGLLAAAEQTGAQN